ncbi:hypothetical protein K488DRAFT_72713 [Vararia minispora EC-137]|uniref:Uncharacterized protein n=1 Tax=Vararia minispora EC-137 TaxID=1314806 RepID=A0ACB8QD85_9AGAM|nr:hypothetical protein K488DRAFT_72713 [Vararia minispora EC-137]
MSVDTLDEWIALTQQTSQVLEDRSTEDVEGNQALAGRIDIALALLPSFRASLKGGKNGSQKDCAARIPKEVFENIMQYALTLSPIAIRTNEVADLGWVKLSHVCRAWRRFAIACEGAWASCIGQLPRATGEFLEHAGSTPVDVIITGQRPALPSQALAFSSADEASVGAVLESIDLSRVRTLIVADGRARIAPFAKRLDAQPASLPLLSHIVLEDYSWNISDEDACYFEDGSCCLHAPNLKTVKLKNCFLDLNCSALTSLDIEYDGRVSPRAGGDKLASVLLGCSALKTLRLHNSQSFQVFDNVVQNEWPDLEIDVADLPDLEYLSITGPAHSIEEVLWLVWFPPTTVVHLDVCVWPVGVPDVVRQLARCFHDHLSQDFRTIAIDHDIRFGQVVTRMRMWKSASLVELIPAIRFGVLMKGDDFKPHLEITVRDHDAGRWSTVVNSFVRKVRSGSVHSLALTLPFTEYSGDAVLRWIEVLDRFPNLKRVRPNEIRGCGRPSSVSGGTLRSDAPLQSAPPAMTIPGTAQKTEVESLFLTDPVSRWRWQIDIRSVCCLLTIPAASQCHPEESPAHSNAGSMPNAVVIYPNEPEFNHAPALASRDNISCLMTALDLPSDESGRIGDESISQFLACDARHVCSFFDPKRTVFNWHYSVYAGRCGIVNEVANIVRPSTGLPIRGPVVIVKDAPQQLWHKLDTSISVADLAASLWTYHKTGMDAGQVYGERALIRWLGLPSRAGGGPECPGATIMEFKGPGDELDHGGRRTRSVKWSFANITANCPAHISSRRLERELQIFDILDMTSRTTRTKKRARGNSGDELEYEGPEESSGSTETVGTMDSNPPVDDVDPSSVPSLSAIAVQSATISSSNLSDTPLSESTEGVIATEPACQHPTASDSSEEQDSGSALVIKHANSLGAKLAQRIRSLAVRVDDEEAVYAPRKIPDDLEWSSSNLKDSKLMLPGKNTPVSVLIVGRVNWNGMIPKPSANSSPGVAYITIEPLVEGDLAKMRDLMGRYSSSGSGVDTMKSVRASRMMSYRERNNPDMQVETFSHVFDARNGKTDVDSMEMLDPSFVMQHDIVLIEVSLGRYRDTKTRDWTKYRLSLELDAVFVLAQAPKDLGTERSPAKKIRL